jgi:hypothetical protein
MSFLGRGEPWPGWYVCAYISPEGTVIRNDETTHDLLAEIIFPGSLNAQDACDRAGYAKFGMGMCCGYPAVMVSNYREATTEQWAAGDQLLNDWYTKRDAERLADEAGGKG